MCIRDRPGTGASSHHTGQEKPLGPSELRFLRVASLLRVCGWVFQGDFPLSDTWTERRQTLDELHSQPDCEALNTDSANAGRAELSSTGVGVGTWGLSPGGWQEP